jgi:hypothetical protein
MKEHAIIEPDDKLKVLDMYVVDVKPRKTLESTELRAKDDTAGQELRRSMRYCWLA